MVNGVFGEGPTMVVLVDRTIKMGPLRIIIQRSSRKETILQGSEHDDIRRGVVFGYGIKYTYFGPPNHSQLLDCQMVLESVAKATTLTLPGKIICCAQRDVPMNS